MQESDDPDAERWLRLAQTEQDKLRIIRAGGEDMAEDLAQYDELRGLGVDPEVAIKLVGTPDHVVDGVLDGKLNADDALKVAELKWSERHHILNSDLDADTISEILGGDYGDGALDALLMGDDDRVDRLLLDPETRAATDVNVAMPTLLGDDEHISFDEIVERTESRKAELIQMYLDQGMSEAQAEAAYGDLQDSVDFYVGDQEARDRLDGAVDDDSREGNPDADNKFSVEDAQIRALEALEQSEAPSAQRFRLEIYEEKITAGERVRVGSVPASDQEAVADLIIDHNVEVVETAEYLSPEFEQAMGRLNELRLDAQDSPIRSHVANEFLEIGLETKAEVGDSDADEDFNRQQLAILMTNSGLQLMTESEKAAQVEALAEQEFTLPDDSEISGTELMIMALDLDERHSNMGHGLGAYWQDDNMWTWRIKTTDDLLNSVLNPDGTLKPGGSELVDEIVVVLPEYALDVTEEDLEGFGPPEGVPEFEFRATMLQALSAPNYGLTVEEYGIVQRLEEIDAQVTGDIAVDGPAAERLVEQLGLTDGERAQFDQLLQSGMDYANALRVARSGDDPELRDRRVEVTREALGIGFDDKGNPRVPFDPAGSDLSDEALAQLALELVAYSQQQIAEYDAKNDAEVPEPLNSDELEALGQLSEILPSLPSDIPTVQALEEIAAGDGPDAARAQNILDHEKVLAMALNAAENETFLTSDPDGDEVMEFQYDHDGNMQLLEDGIVVTRRGRGSSVSSPVQISVEDVQALQVQLGLYRSLAPHTNEIDTARYGGEKDGTLSDEDFAAWVKANPDIPPALRDQVYLARYLELYEDPFSRDEVKQIAGVVGIVATSILVAPVSVPTWLTVAATTAVVVAAAIEVGIAFSGDDHGEASLAAVGLIFDGADFWRLGRSLQIQKVADALKISDDAAAVLVDQAQLGRLLNQPSLSPSEQRQLVELLEEGDTALTPAAVASARESLSPQEYRAWVAEQVAISKNLAADSLRAEGVPTHLVDEVLGDFNQTVLKNDPETRALVEGVTDPSTGLAHVDDDEIVASIARGNTTVDEIVDDIWDSRLENPAWFRSDFDDHVRSPDVSDGGGYQRGHDGGISGGHNADEFEDALADPTGHGVPAIVESRVPIVDSSGRVIGERITYRLPKLEDVRDADGRIVRNADGTPVTQVVRDENGDPVPRGGKRAPVKSVYDPSVVSDAEMNQTLREVGIDALRDKYDDVLNEPGGYLPTIVEVDGVDYLVHLRVNDVGQPYVANVHVN